MAGVDVIAEGHNYMSMAGVDVIAEGARAWVQEHKSLSAEWNHRGAGLFVCRPPPLPHRAIH